MKLPRSSPLPANGQGESVLRGVPKSRPESKWLRVSDVDDDDGDDDNEYDMVVMTIDFNGCLRKKVPLIYLFLVSQALRKEHYDYPIDSPDIRRVPDQGKGLWPAPSLDQEDLSNKMDTTRMWYYKYKPSHAGRPLLYPLSPTAVPRS